MAVTGSGKMYKMTALNDSLNSATVGYNDGKPFRTRVVAIDVYSTTTTGAFAIKANGGSGTIIFQSTSGPVANEMAGRTFPEGQDFDDLTVTALAAGLTVIVHLA